MYTFNNKLPIIIIYFDAVHQQNGYNKQTVSSTHLVSSCVENYVVLVATLRGPVPSAIWWATKKKFLLASRHGITGIKIHNAFLTFLIGEKCQNWRLVLESLKIERQIVIEKQIIYKVSTANERNGAVWNICVGNMS
jgi:hypothetical protein